MSLREVAMGLANDPGSGNLLADLVRFQRSISGGQDRSLRKNARERSEAQKSDPNVGPMQGPVSAARRASPLPDIPSPSPTLLSDRATFDYWQVCEASRSLPVRAGHRPWKHLLSTDGRLIDRP